MLVRRVLQYCAWDLRLFFTPVWHACVQENGEAIQVLHYQDGQKYEPHNDYFFDSYNQRPENGGQRIATVLMYLYALPVGSLVSVDASKSGRHLGVFSGCRPILCRLADTIYAVI